MDTSIRQLLEMLDNPEAYSEQEIREIINRDEETRETYRLMVKAKRSSRHRQTGNPVDVDAAWQQLNNKVSHSSHFTLHTSRFKIAASFVGVLLLSGIALAAIRSLTSDSTPKVEESENTLVSDTVKQVTTSLSPLKKQERTPVTYDNMPLEKMLTEIANHYEVKVTFQNDELRTLRFRFVWNPQKDIRQVVSDLNQFERLTVTFKDNQIIVE